MIVQAMLMIPELRDDPNLLQIVGNTYRVLLELQASNGSFPIKLDETSVEQKKFQWCHGAPGAISPFLAASKLFNEIDPELKGQCLQAAVKAGEGTYQYGLLLKGNGLCHGISGNGYMLHSLTRYFTDQQMNP